MKVSGTRNPNVPNLAQTNEELNTANAGINSSAYVRNRGMEIVIPEEPNPNREVQYPRGDMKISSNPYLDINIDKMTKEQIVEALEAHLAQCYTE